MKKSSRKPRSTIPISPAKRRLFFAITIAFPFALVLLIETVIRLFDLGPDLSLFTTEKMYGKDYYVLNAEVKRRYFPTVAFNPSVSPDYFPVVKEPGTYRIFCLGASTTVGYPYWYNGSFASYLRDRLHAIFPDRQIEIINMGLTATNSYTVLDMASDLIPYQPDLFIVYDGHNEFYGALGIASNESLGSARWVTTTYLKLMHIRTFALLRDLYTRVRELISGTAHGGDAGTLMERLARGQYVPYQSRTYNNGLAIFKANLQDLKALCADHRIPLIVSAQVSNLRNQAPFISAHSAGFSPEARRKFDEAMKKGLVEMSNARIDSALVLFRRASAVDSTCAESHFRTAQCLDALGQYASSRLEYVRARDYDELRFRTSTDFNDAIRAIADGHQVFFADMERVFNQNSPDSITGRDLMFEHLHPRARGHFLMAEEYARLMRRHGLLAPADMWQVRDTVNNDRLWSERNVTELDERVANRRTEVLTSGWPFHSQEPTVDPVAPDDTLGEITEQVTKGIWDWKQAHEAAANYYLMRHELGKAEREYKVILDELPLIDVQDYLRLAKVLLDENKISELQDALRASLKLRPTILAYRALGDIALQTNRPSEAIGYYERIAGFDQSPAEQAENGYLLGLAFYRASKPDSAANQLIHVLNIKPDYQPAVELLAKINSPAQ